jgi:hypothetical protein
MPDAPRILKRDPRRAAEHARRLRELAHQYPAELGELRSGSITLSGLKRLLDVLRPAGGDAYEALVAFCDWMDAPLRETIANLRGPPTAADKLRKTVDRWRGPPKPPPAVDITKPLPSFRLPPPPGLSAADLERLAAIIIKAANSAPANKPRAASRAANKNASDDTAKRSLRPRERAKRALLNIPNQAELSDDELTAAINIWLQNNRTPGIPHRQVSKDTCLRAAGRRQDGK